jgi:hypothetical protein
MDAFKPRSPIPTPQSVICNPQSALRNRQSALRNLQQMSFVNEIERNRMKRKEVEVFEAK